ncbi:response regulator transcription factor [Anaerolineales bacterium]
MSNLIRIIIIDDNPDIHDVVKKIVSNTENITLVGQAYDGESGLKLCQIAKPDLILMDVMMPKMNGAETTLAVLKILPDIKILVLSSFYEQIYIRSMLSSGAVGYLVKTGLAQDLITTIENTVQGNTVLSSQAAKAFFSSKEPENDDADFNLTERELQVLKLMAEGLTYGGIAHTLRISSPTVRFHIINILEKMGVETRLEALVLAARNHLV